jgi:hypothetical protein
LHENPTDKRKDAPERSFTDPEARKLWDALIFLKLKCPSLDVKNHIAHVEKFMQQEAAVAATQA